MFLSFKKLVEMGVGHKYSHHTLYIIHHTFFLRLFFYNIYVHVILRFFLIIGQRILFLLTITDTEYQFIFFDKLIIRCMLSIIFTTVK